MGVGDAKIGPMASQPTIARRAPCRVAYRVQAAGRQNPGVTGLRMLAAAALLVPAVACGFEAWEYENLESGTNSTAGRAIRTTTDEIFEMLNAGSWSDLHTTSIREIRDTSSVLDIEAQFGSALEELGLFGALEVLEIHKVVLEESHARGTRYATTPFPSQALPPAVVLSSPVTGQLAFVLGKSIRASDKLPYWVTMILKKEQAHWRWVNITLRESVIDGRNGQWYLQSALQFLEKGQARNALLYGSHAVELVQPSDAMRPISLDQLLMSLPDPGSLNLPFPGHRSPEVWKLDGGPSVTVFYSGTVSGSNDAGSFLWLEFRYLTAQEDVQSDDASNERRRVYEYITANFPEYWDAFDGIFIGSVNSSEVGFREAYPFAE